MNEIQQPDRTPNTEAALVCDVPSGVCGPGVAVTQRVSVTYVTDPICSACWAMEPAWRAIEFHYGELLDVRHVYGGLLPSWDGFADATNGISGYLDVRAHWEDIAELTGQALNASVWTDDPIMSSYSPSVVVVAVRDVAPALEGVFLRRLREELFVHGRNISRPEVWSPVVCALGIDLDAVRASMSDGRANDLFAADLALARSLRATAFPTLVVESPDSRTTLRGVQSLVRLEQVVAAAAGIHPARRPVTMEEAVGRLGLGTGAEYAALLGLPVTAIQEALPKLGLTAYTLPGGTAWLR